AQRLSRTCSRGIDSMLSFWYAATHNDSILSNTGACMMDWKLELVIIPVTDVDRAKAFYVEQAGFVADHDHLVHEAVKFLQLTPPGSACSIAIGTGLTESPPGSAYAQIVVDDVPAAREELLARGLDVSEVQRLDWGQFVFFADPDGNRWALQQPVRGG